MLRIGTEMFEIILLRPLMVCLLMISIDTSAYWHHQPCNYQQLAISRTHPTTCGLYHYVNNTRLVNNASRLVSHNACMYV